MKNKNFDCNLSFKYFPLKLFYKRSFKFLHLNKKLNATKYVTTKKKDQNFSLQIDLNIPFESESE